MNRAGVDAALELALRLCPALGMGVHLVLTSGSPLLGSKVPSLTHGELDFPNLEEQMARITALDLEEVKAEWRSQIERFIAITGRKPDHLDSHHHFSYYTPQLFKLQLEFARELGCAIRLPTHSILGKEVMELPEEMLAPLLDGVPALLKEYAPRHPNTFIASFYDETTTPEVLSAILTSLPEGVSELMCHPGLVDALLLSPTGSTYNRRREVELDLLTSPHIQQLVRKQAIELINFGQL